jgi:hypothetical protein
VPGGRPCKVQTSKTLLVAGGQADCGLNPSLPSAARLVRSLLYLASTPATTGTPQIATYKRVSIANRASIANRVCQAWCLPAASRWQPLGAAAAKRLVHTHVLCGQLLPKVRCMLTLPPVCAAHLCLVCICCDPHVHAYVCFACICCLGFRATAAGSKPPPWRLNC